MVFPASILSLLTPGGEGAGRPLPPPVSVGVGVGGGPRSVDGAGGGGPRDGLLAAGPGLDEGDDADGVLSQVAPAPVGVGDPDLEDDAAPLVGGVIGAAAPGGGDGLIGIDDHTALAVEIRQGESVGALEQGLAPLEVALARPDGQVLDGSPLDENGSGTVIGVRGIDIAVVDVLVVGVEGEEVGAGADDGADGLPRDAGAQPGRRGGQAGGDGRGRGGVRAAGQNRKTRRNKSGEAPSDAEESFTFSCHCCNPSCRRRPRI